MVWVVWVVWVSGHVSGVGGVGGVGGVDGVDGVGCVWVVCFSKYLLCILVRLALDDRLSVPLVHNTRGDVGLLVHEWTR